MVQPTNDTLTSPAVDKLVTMVEEATRATKDSPRRFIEPARGTLDRAKSRRHHIIFGRRGSGKTSLLRKAGADLTLGRIPTAFIDLEAFKGHTYPDVLISILLETLRTLKIWVGSAGSNPASKTSFSILRNLRLNRVTVFKLFRQIARAAGLPESLQHPHVLKHTAAMLMVRAGANAFLIRQHLGHRSFDSTLQYVNPSDADASAAFAKACSQAF